MCLLKPQKPENIKIWKKDRFKHNKQSRLFIMLESVFSRVFSGFLRHEF